MFRFHFLKNETGTIPENIETKAIKWASGKTATETSPDLYCETNDIFSARLQSLSIKLSKITEIKEIFPLLIAVAGEIGNNSYNHNIGSWPDVPGVFFGYDMQKKLIILADRGQGILKTLKRVLPELKNDQEALQIAFTRYISARAPEDRGNGLKFVKDIILSNPIKLLFYSGQILLEIDKNSGLKFKKNKIKFPGCLAIINY